MNNAAIPMMLMLICITLLACTVRAETSGVSARNFERKLTIKVSADYLLYLPSDYNPKSKKRWPLILFLHGAGERGSDVQRVKIHGVIKVAEAKPDFPFIVAAPQCPEGSWWDKKLDVLSALLDELAEKYKVDKDRIYLTGLSMGGYGTWALADDQPDRFAAIAPICGSGSPLTACRLKDVPIWVFHGAKDDVVPIKGSLEMVDALKKCGAPEVKLTVYPEAGHDAWTETYNNPELYAWFLAHKRKPAEPRTASPASE